MALVTCAALAAALLSPAGGRSFELSQNCADVVVSHYHDRPIVIDALGHTVTGFRVLKSGGNVTLRGGILSAPKGEDGRGPDGYGANLQYSRDVTIEAMRFVNFNRGIVTNFAEKARIIGNRFEMGHDGVHANGGRDIDISNNVFIGVTSRPSTCQLPDGVEKGIAARDCKAKGGVWTDGWHQDAIQVRNGIKGLSITGNTISGVQQGIGQMAARTDLPMENVVVRNNKVSINGFHSITINNATDIEITGNSVAQETGRRTIIRATPDARVCGNKIQFPKDPGGQPC